MNLEETLHHDLRELSDDVQGGPDLQRAIHTGRATRRRRHLAIGTAAAASVVAVTVGAVSAPGLLDRVSPDTHGSGPAASCVPAIRFHGTYFFRAKAYVDHGPVRVGPPVGTAVFPLVCNDGGPPHAQRFSKPFTVYAVRGSDPSDIVIGPAQGQGPQLRTIYVRNTPHGLAVTPK